MTTEQEQHDGTSAPTVLLLGQPGTGKTFSLATLAAAPTIDKFFYLYTDKGGDESLIDALMHYEVPVEKVHWHYVPAATEDWDTMKEVAMKINTMGYESLASMKSGINKLEHRGLFKLIESLADFKCDRTGESFGPTDRFPQNWAIAYDSLSGLNKLAKGATVGSKPTLHQGEWGVAMAAEDMFLQQFTANIACPSVLIAHMDQQRDEYTGRMIFHPQLLGNKLGPNIGHLFSDVLLAYQEGGKFMWSNSDDRVALKSRNLPLGEKHAPDFRVLLEKWAKRKEYIQGQRKEKESA